MPAVSVDISSVTSADDTLLSAAMLSTWSYGSAVIDASTALAEAGLAPPRRYLAVLDELWRATHRWRRRTALRRLHPPVVRTLRLHTEVTAE